MSSIFDNPRLLSSFEWIGDKIPGGFFVYRAGGNLEILYANKSVLRIFGCADMKEFTELTGNTFNGLVHPDDLGEVLDSIEEQISDESGDKMDYVEYRIIRRDGSVRWVDDYGHFAQLEGYGDVFYVFISDITEKYNEKKENIRRSNVYTGLSECFLSPLRKCLASCRANLSTGLIDIVKGDDLYDTDYEGGLFEDYLASRLDSFLNDDDREAFKVLFNADNLTDRFYKGGGRSSFVAYCRRNSGIQCFVKFSAAVAIEPESGERIIFCRETEYNDEKVSEVLNEKVLVKQYDMVTYIVNDNYSVVIGDISKNRKGSICPVRKSGIYTDYIKNQVIPAVSESVHIKSELEEALSPLTVARELEKSDSYNLDVTCDIDGEIYIKRFSFYAVNKEMNFYLLLKSDVTDVLRKGRRQNELLAYALSEAEHANAAKTAFLSNMSHEIRTPMNAIIGLNTIALKDDTISEQTRDYLKKIGESANHLLVLINDILDMSRIESGRFTLSKEDFSFSSLISRINAMVQSQCADKGLNYECALNGDLNEWYYGDDSKLRQVLLNILSNAVKFTNAPGKVTLSVEKVSEFDKHSTLRFIICDTGIGMNPDFLPKIF
ncbi:MAG: PAS domain-containing protein, partial [Ruminococcus sp.]|nr:PAS domain-containing protein [Ruminococcus sp.]